MLNLQPYLYMRIMLIYFIGSRISTYVVLTYQRSIKVELILLPDKKFKNEDVTHQKCFRYKSDVTLIYFCFVMLCYKVVVSFVCCRKNI